jgi:hypothetical protein
MRFIQAGFLTLLAAAILAAPASAATPGSAGLGDRLFPTLGNGGYDAKHYDLGLYGSTAPEQSVRGVVQMSATATQSLSRFNLDYAGATSRACGSTAARPPSGTTTASW